LLLGLTPGRVSQIAQTSSSMFFDSGNASDDIQLVKVQTADGWVEGHGRGALPESIDFAGTVYIRTGGSTSINGSAWKHTYARA